MPPPRNISDVRLAARRRLPRVAFDVIDGGAADEITLRANTAAFRSIRFRPRPLEDVSKRDLGIEVFGTRISMPVMLAPTGAGRIVNRSAELEVARAALRAGTVYVQATGSSYPYEAVAEASDGTAWFQMYVPPTRPELEALLDRIGQAGFKALVLAIDTPVFGTRERDTKNHFTVPFKLRPGHLAQGIVKPAWTIEFLRGNVGPGMVPSRYGQARTSLKESQEALLAAAYPVTWEDVAAVRRGWPGRLLIKGIMRPDECPRLVEEFGVDGLIVSNHGGRQLDGVPATIEVLPAVVEAVGGRIPVFLDGGVRRGGDVLKAVALGATAVLVGRPYLYGLAWAGGEGVSRVLEILRAEVDRDLALLGCRSVGEVDRGFVDR